MTVRREGPGVKNLVVALKDLDGLEGKTGWFETAHYPGGTPVAYVATIHEFGTAHIPARPFMRPAVQDNGPEWMKLFEQGATAIIQGTYTAREVLEMVTLRAAGDIAKKIQAVTAPPLSPITIARKGHDKPLIDTGQMSQSVTGKVESV